MPFFSRSISVFNDDFAHGKLTTKTQKKINHKGHNGLTKDTEMVLFVTGIKAIYRYSFADLK